LSRSVVSVVSILFDRGEQRENGSLAVALWRCRRYISRNNFRKI
jgi:hypothetical protein